MVGLNRDEILIRKINVVVGCDPHGLGVSNSHYSALLRVCVCVCVCGARNIDQAEKRMTLSLCILMTIGDQRILLKYFSVYHWSCNCPDYQCFCASALFLLNFWSHHIRNKLDEFKYLKNLSRHNKILPSLAPLSCMFVSTCLAIVLHIYKT